MEINYEKLGLRIRQARKAKGLTQEKLSEMVDLSPNYLSRVETSNGGVISLPALVKICNALDVGMDYMLSDSLKVSESNILSLNALNEEDLQHIEVIVRKFVKYKTNLLLGMRP